MDAICPDTGAARRQGEKCGTEGHGLHQSSAGLRRNVHRGKMGLIGWQGRTGHASHFTCGILGSLRLWLVNEPDTERVLQMK